MGIGAVLGLVFGVSGGGELGLESIPLGPEPRAPASLRSPALPFTDLKAPALQA